eukprot:CAMPEP_0172492022 /NCGR_PEP_ID=MMETSP1066-20121228/22995_1 /TAXON_ID=671091 /ORGANISM="Coscinodiscus wailesii, Strain CCMP2513" /LENGTH=148 /DNA_ID=CAMNT_0013261389 /DNA_START=85 /DNA_END=531 /DNA_ORIENTATION=-
MAFTPLNATLLRRAVAAAHGPLSRRYAADKCLRSAPPPLVRPFSVVVLGDDGAVEKFRTANSKSVLYFTASWCPPCKAIAPVYEQMSDKYPGIAFGKVDVDDQPDAAMEFDVRAVPTFVLSNGEDVKESFSGADAAKLESLVVNLEKI